MKISKLSTKLIVSLLVAGLLPLLIAGMVVLSKTNNALEERAFSQLESLRSNKTQQVEEYFADIENQLLTFSRSIMVSDAMNEFSYSFFHDADNHSKEEYKASVESYYKNQFAGEYQLRNNKSINAENIIPSSKYALYHQYEYIANSEFPLGEKDKLDKSESTGLYNVAHEKYHPIIRDYQNKFGYYDIFLVEPENGYIVYSVFKEIDYATSLIDGPHKTSNMAKAFKAAVVSEKTSVIYAEDFSPYLPSFDAPASFMASPIYDSGRLLGVLIFQMPADRINSFMNDVEGLGETGQVYLLGLDNLMRNQSRLIDEPTLLSTKIDTIGSQKAFSGETGLSIFDNENGSSVLSAYAPLNINGYNWAILAEIEEREAFSVMRNIQIILAEVALVLILAVVALAYFVMRSVSKQLGGDPTDLLKIAEDIVNGKLEREDSDAEKDANAKGVYAAMIEMQDTLKESIETDKKKTRRIERIKQALDNVSSCVIVADVNLEIMYSNNRATDLFFSVESDYQKELPNFNAKNLVGSEIGVLYKDAEKQRSIFRELSKTLVADITVSGHTMRTTANPIITENNERIGTVIEWRDMTAEIAVENEVQSLVDSALEGDLSQRISLDNKSGFFGRLSKGINDLVNVSDQVINDTIRVLSAISHGDLNEKIEAQYKGSFDQLKTDVNNTIDKLTDIVRSIKESSSLVNSGADEISRGNLDLSRRTETQAASLEETSSSMEEMTSSVKQNADNSKHANELAIGAREQAQKSGDVVSEAVTAMAKINDASNKIAEITGVIDEIAFQTNLLALNAAVEAARAGEQGRGFAVVATEVRNLAGRSATAAKEIKELIEDSVEKVEHGSDLVNQSGKTLEEIMGSIKQVAEIIGDISYASSEQATGIEQVNKAIISMDETTQNNAALVEQAAAAAESMNEQSNELMRLIGFFNVDNQASNLSGLSKDDLSDMSSKKSQPNSLPHSEFKKAAGDGIVNDDWEQF